ncbi:MAG: glycosyltransferase family 4 protein [Candidatus Magasanikbacteria bacterium]|nr:glycosyltransferase family 4 protein [Candidatus Magasanikbacteria bacterium]
MKILIASGIFVPELGGPACYAKNIAEEFAALGHVVCILTYSNVAAHDDDARYPFRVLRIQRTSTLSNYWRYAKTLLRIGKQYDYIYAFDHFSAGIPASLANLFLRKKMAIRIGGDFIWERFLGKTGAALALRDYYEQGLYQKDWLRFVLIKWVFGRADILVFTTRFQADIFVRYYGCDKRKLAFIENPLPETVIEAQTAQRSKEILCAGRIINKNNIKPLLDAFSSIDQTEIGLVIIGEGEQKSELEAYARSQNYNHTRFEPALSRDGLTKRIARSYAMVFPSLTDISPNTMLDCIAAKTPFITSEEIGYDWVLKSAIHFNPRKTEDIKQSLKTIMSPEGYEKAKQALNSLRYTYSFKEAAKDTLRLFGKGRDE